MKIELANGKTIEVPIEKFIDLDDDEYEDFIESMMAADAGYEITDVFSNTYLPASMNTSDNDIQIEQLPEDEIKRIEDEFEEE